MITIKNVKEKENKTKIVTDILNDLPEWFGLEDSTLEYINNSKDYPLIAAFIEDQAVGFVSLKETSKDTLEIYCMGILKLYHNQQIGTLLYKYIEKEYSDTYTFIQVKTVAFGNNEHYDKTNAFYKSLGFKELEIFPTLWDEHNPCQIYIKVL